MSNGNGHRWSKFWWCDWQNDAALRMCSLGAQGYWMRALCLMHEADPVGHLTVNGRSPTTRQLSAITGATEKEVTLYTHELEENGVFSRLPDGTIYCRRMVRDAATSEQAALSGSVGGNPHIIRGIVPKGERERRFRRRDAPVKAQRIFDKSGGRCHWCAVVLQQDHAGPDFFQIDHVVPIRDGGGNEEANLVAACSECNHKRARHNSDPNQLGSDDYGRNSSDPNSDPKLDLRSLEAEEEPSRSPPAVAGGRRADGTNPRAVGTNPRASGANPRETGTNPRAKPSRNPFNDMARREGIQPVTIDAIVDFYEFTGVRPKLIGGANG